MQLFVFLFYKEFDSLVNLTFKTMETNENSELSGENLKLPKTIFQKLSFFYKNLNKFWFSMVALVLIGYSFNDYFARDIGT